MTELKKKEFVDPQQLCDWVNVKKKVVVSIATGRFCHTLF